MGLGGGKVLSCLRGSPAEPAAATESRSAALSPAAPRSYPCRSSVLGPPVPCLSSVPECNRGCAFNAARPQGADRRRRENTAANHRQGVARSLHCLRSFMLPLTCDTHRGHENCCVFWIAPPNVLADRPLASSSCHSSSPTF